MKLRATSQSQTLKCYTAQSDGYSSECPTWISIRDVKWMYSMSVWQMATIPTIYVKGGIKALHLCYSGQHWKQFSMMHRRWSDRQLCQLFTASHHVIRQTAWQKCIIKAEENCICNNDRDGRNSVAETLIVASYALANWMVSSNLTMNNELTTIIALV